MSGPEQDRLDSWKEIADYLRRDLRTVRRWENERSLPVHRVPGGGRAAVYASRTEVDAWLSGQEGKPAAARGTESSSALPLPAPPRGGPRNRTLWLGALLALAGALVFLAFWGWRHLSGGPLARVAFSGSELVAWNEQGRVLWTYSFGQPLNPSPSNPMQERVSIVDLGPDGRQDILVVPPLYSSDRVNSPSDGLYCLSGNGKLSWQHSFDDLIRVGGHDYGPPWEFSALMMTSDGSYPSIWYAEREVFSSGSTLTELDRDGHLKARFVNWGHIAVINHFRDAGGFYILAGGISNQCNCAMLAVLREDHPSGSSPRLNESAFDCDNCPEGDPYRYLLFPRSELTEMSGTAYNNLKLIQVGSGHVSVGVSETASPEVPGADWERYDLSESFVPQSVWVSEHYWTLHRQMEAEGKIHHTVEQCPERIQPKTVRMWSPEHGWEKIQVPIISAPP